MCRATSFCKARWQFHGKWLELLKVCDVSPQRAQLGLQTGVRDSLRIGHRLGDGSQEDLSLNMATTIEIIMSFGAQALGTAEHEYGVRLCVCDWC